MGLSRKKRRDNPAHFSLGDRAVPVGFYTLRRHALVRGHGCRRRRCHATRCANAVMQGFAAKSHLTALSSQLRSLPWAFLAAGIADCDAAHSLLRS